MRVTGVFLCLSILVVSECIGYYYPPVFWHWQNCVFRQLTESFEANITKEYFMKVLPYNRVRIVCPNFVAINDWKYRRIAYGLFENLWLVDKNGYDNCKVNDDTNPAMNKKILTCNQVSRVVYKEFHFAPGSNLQEPRFAPGRHYYFIATGNKKRDGLDSKSGGHCKKYHMKLHIYVCNPKIETCVWDMPTCEPPYEFKRSMTEFSRSLPPPTRAAVTLPPPPITTEEVVIQTTTINTITTKSSRMMMEQQGDPCDQEEDDGASVHLILNFVLGGVILFMAVVIVILACGLARKSDSKRPASAAFSAISGQEPNANHYQDSALYMQPTYVSPASKSPPQTPVSVNAPFYLAPMAEIRPRSASNKNSFNNATYGKRQYSVEGSTTQVEAVPMLSDNYPNAPEPI